MQLTIQSNGYDKFNKYLHQNAPAIGNKSQAFKVRARRSDSLFGPDQRFPGGRLLFLMLYSDGAEIEPNIYFLINLFNLYLFHQINCILSSVIYFDHF